MITPVYARGDINQVSGALARAEEPLFRALSVIDSLDSGNRLNIGLNHEVNVYKLELVKELLDQGEEKDLRTIKQKFDAKIAQIREEYLLSFGDLMAARDQAIFNGYCLSLNTDERRAAVLADYAVKLDVRLNHYRDSFTIAPDADLRALAGQLEAYVQGRIREFEAVQDEQTELSMEYIALEGRLNPTIRAIRQQLTVIRSNEPVNLHHACSLGQYHAVVQFMHDFRPSLLTSMKRFLNAEDNGFRPLDYAAFKGNRRIVKELLRNGADPTKPNLVGYTPLHWAAQAGNKEAAWILLRGDKIDVNARGEFGRTPLHMSTFQGHCDVTRLLLGHPNIQCNAQTTPEGFSLTPLHNSVQQGDKKTVIALLFDNRVNPHLRSAPTQQFPQGESPFEMAVVGRFSHDAEVIQAFLENPNFRKSNTADFIQELTGLSQRANGVAVPAILSYVVGLERAAAQHDD